jgi:DNA polymerase-1
MPTARPKLVLIDAHALIHRAFHAIPFLATKDGELTNAVFGFTATVLSVLKELKPEYIAVSFDLPEPTFRHKQYSEYKATRQKAPDELRSQFGRVREVVDALGIPVFEVKGYEADDVLGTLAKRYATENGLEAYIVTGDKDSLQLVDEHIKIFTLRKGIKDTIIYDLKLLKEETGLTPDEFIEYKALKGDPSDNIPGVPGIGDKTATILVQKYQTLEGLYEALDQEPADHPDIKPKVRSNLAEFKDQAYLSRDLSRIVTDIDLPFDLEACHVQKMDGETAIQLFTRLQFTSLIPRLRDVLQWEASAAESTQVSKPRTKDRPAGAERNSSYELVDTEAKLKKLVTALGKQPEFAYDTETHDIDSIAQNLVGLSFSWEEHTGYYVPVGHAPAAGTSLDLTQTLAALEPVLTDSKVGKIAHHAKYDYEVLRAYGLEVQGLVFDTMLGSYLINPGGRSLGLDALALQELGIEVQPISELLGEKKKDQISFADVPTDQAAAYAAEDADITWQLYQKFKPQMELLGVETLLDEVELPLIPVLAAMEQRGVMLDQRFFASQSEKFKQELDGIQKRIHQYAGHEFNINSPSQLSVVLFDELKLGKGTTKLGGKHKSTAASELEKLKGTHEIVDELLRYRELAKLRSTYLEALPKLVREDTGRLHTHYSQTVAATGRLSSHDPNLQNIPIRTELGREIRKGFVTEKGYQLVAADYSQFELRIAAHMTGDPGLTEKFEASLDIHAATAAEVAGVELADVTPEQRYAAKAVNFSILYGATPHGVAKSTGMSVKDASAYIERYFAAYPKLKEYMDAQITKAQTEGYVENMFGRRRYLPEINASTYPVREAAKRMAINMPIQGSQADILKMAMIKIYRDLSSVSPKSHLVLTVHDELVLEVPDPDVKQVAAFVKDEMEAAYRLSVPVIVEAKAGPNWGEMAPL